ncbi:hypothetical protein NQZ68_003990 [Dissostichus eleginoides]|nr:hypothetical protein NQZ68_003990 [Dissostichus eleginoides]
MLPHSLKGKKVPGILCTEVFGKAYYCSYQASELRCQESSMLAGQEQNCGICPINHEPKLHRGAGRECWGLIGWKTIWEPEFILNKETCTQKS